VALLDEGDDVNTTFSQSRERVEQFIDNNAFLPESLDGFPFRVVGTGVNT
jgi:hypothetical protein